MSIFKKRRAKWLTALAAMTAAVVYLVGCMNPMSENEPQASKSDIKKAFDLADFTIPVAPMYLLDSPYEPGVFELDNPLEPADTLVREAASRGKVVNEYRFADANHSGEDLTGRIIYIDSIPFFNEFCVGGILLAGAISVIVEDSPSDFYVNFNQLFADCEYYMGDKSTEAYEMLYRLFVSGHETVTDFADGGSWVFSDVHPSQIKRGNSGEYLANVNYMVPTLLRGEFSRPVVTGWNYSNFAYGTVVNDPDVVCEDPNREVEADGSCAASCKDGYTEDEDGICKTKTTTSILEHPRVIPRNY
ncbi:MAG: hypothetical protein LBB56_08840 [Chitinispirillales bacterium]|jgi:hypothetical protein|nr:hypothetical protein [Chitinispirillales bacterium]